MKKCKNIECDHTINENRTYCSLTCRNVYVNKYLRDYTKCSQTLKKKYSENYKPHKCLKCDNKIPFEKKNNLYCSHSCAAKQTNKGRKDNELTRNKKSLGLKKHHDFLGHDIHGERKCKHCNIKFKHKRSQGRKFCSKECRTTFQRKDLNEYQKYRLDAKFKFNIFQYPEEFDLELVEKHGIYKAKNRGDNLNGVSRDHMYSIRDGFDNNIDVSLISHPANCRLILQKENSSKHRKSIITIEELKENIYLWYIKYEINKRGTKSLG